MSQQHNDIEARAEKQLKAYLEEAVSGGADSIILEYVPEGLEICFVFGDTGTGCILKDFKVAGDIMQLIGERAGLDTKSKGTMTWEIQDQAVKIAVEEYNSFGECAFRLKLARGKARR